MCIRDRYGAGDDSFALIADVEACRGVDREEREVRESVDKGAANERGCLSEQPNGVIPALTLTLAGSRYDNAKLSQARCAFVAGSFNGWVRRSFLHHPR